MRFSGIATFESLGGHIQGYWKEFSCADNRQYTATGSQYLYLNPLMMFKRMVVENILVEAGKELVCKGMIGKGRLKAIRDTGKVSMDEWRYYSNMHWAGPQKD